MELEIILNEATQTQNQKHLIYVMLVLTFFTCMGFSFYFVFFFLLLRL